MCSRGRLEDDADQRKKASANERQAAAELVGEIVGQEAGDEATGLEGRDDVLALGRLLAVREISVAKSLLRGRHGEDTANGARLPAEEHAAEAGGEDEGEDAPAVDLGRVLLHGLIANDGLEDLLEHDGRLGAVELGETTRGTGSFSGGL